MLKLEPIFTAWPRFGPGNRWCYCRTILRYAACIEVGEETRLRHYEGDDPLGFVIAMNLHRRHLSESQRGMVAARMANMAVGQPEKYSANLQNTTRATAAEKLNVSERTVNTAKAVQRTGHPDLIAAVDAEKARSVKKK